MAMPIQWPSKVAFELNFGGRADPSFKKLQPSLAAM